MVDTSGRQVEMRYTLPLIAICTGYFMTILDLTVVNVALVNIKQQLGADVTGLQWIVDGYSLVFASFLLTGGALGDRLGGRRVFLGGVTLFTLASTLCGAAPSLFVLQIARAFQGLGAALLVPTTLALINTTFPEARARGRAIGIWAAVATIAAVSGPILGGLLVNALSWRSVFLLNLPIGILCFLLTYRFVAPGTSQGGRSLDLTGQLTSIATLALLTFALIEGSALGISSPSILVAYAGCILFLLLFLWREQRASSPMFPLKMLHERTFSAANIVAVCQTFTFYSSLFILSLFLQQVRHYSASATGFALIPEFGFALLATLIAGKLLSRIGAKGVMLCGLLISIPACLGFWLIDAKSSYPLIACMLALLGFGLSLVLPAMTEAAISHAPKEQSGIASGILNASRQVGGVLGVAILGALVGKPQTFIADMHIAFIIAGGVVALGFIVALCFVAERRTD
ncbi:DHA2 family efflux MFS transporter permease subunit [Ktedonosporobacter rubrisoli]|uniref:DHA2 family efflux MFS transporter permease subunit n=1 Tax=Ktedonosporobacter rubrisoli TaxID=2509675 RepID=A0A4P6JL71_KTERU|nr:MFS transporter [Ktedonosporobacter rubrisoli]QBD75823.1 DHA2 family efflux MFS transporter permease subunit [Ktedonosporobacter rubrisoli]